MQNLRNNFNFLKILVQVRNVSTNSEISPIFTNRNPRNLEKLRIGYKPDGYHLERKGKTYWHKLDLTVSQRYATAVLSHFENGEILKASTSEWAVKKQLYRPNDTSAFINLARVFAYRCFQCGITEITHNIEPRNKDGKVAAFLKTLEENGVCLNEPEQYKKPYPWDLTRPEKPWEITE